MLYKNSMYGLERSLQERILGEQLHKFKRKENLVEKQSLKFNEYR